MKSETKNKDEDEEIEEYSKYKDLLVFNHFKFLLTIFLYI